MPKTKTDVDVGAVLLEELAARTGGSVEVARHWVAQVGGELLEDWAGRECVSARDARRVVEAYEAERAAHERREAEREATLRRWEEERRKAWDEALAEALEVAHREELREMTEGFTVFALPTGSPASSRARARARQAAAEALRRWEVEHPRPS